MFKYLMVGAAALFLTACNGFNYKDFVTVNPTAVASLQEIIAEATGADPQEQCMLLREVQKVYPDQVDTFLAHVPGPVCE